MSATDDMTTAASGPASSKSQPGEWDRLRGLLFGSEQASLNALAAKIGDRESLARSVAGVLAEAAAIRLTQDDSMTRVLEPVVGQSLQRAVLKNPQPLVDALYPIMGPAIRRSITESLADMIQAFNGAIQYSFSPRALLWRIDAWRTGQPYANVVLLKTLVYRVEQVFLIHRDTGLLLAHAQANHVIVQDPDMVSGMLTAIRDFVGDSFNVSHDAGMDAIRLGDLSVQIRLGPKAVLAAVVRGNPPEALRVQLSEALEHLHRSHAAALNEFKGDSAPFADAVLALRPCLTERARARESRTPWRAYLVMGLLAVLLAWWGFTRHQANAEWNEVLDALTHEPGFVVLDAGRTASHRVVGLRDPLARDPRTVIGDERIRRLGIVWQWKPYLSMEPQFLLVRARQVLNPPPGVALAVDGEILRASGAASGAWVREARTRAAFIPGIRTLDASAMVIEGRRDFERAREAVNAGALYFETGSDTLSSARRASLEALLPNLIGVRDGADALQIDYFIDIVGRADAPGTTGLNMRLSQRRADVVRDFLIAHGIPAQRLRAQGIGVAIDDSADVERRVNFAVTLP